MSEVKQVGDHLEWRGYAVEYCELCRCLIIKCKSPNCMGTSCNGTGCEKCVPDHIEFKKIEPEARAEWVFDDREE